MRAKLRCDLRFPDNRRAVHAKQCDGRWWGLPDLLASRVDSVLAVVNADGTANSADGKTDFNASCMTCNSFSLAWAALNRRGEAFDVAERSKCRIAIAHGLTKSRGLSLSTFV